MRITSFLFLLFVFGCSKDPEFRPVYDVPEEFQPFIDTFISEAASRGFTYEIKNLIIKYDETIDVPFCGQCNSNSLNADVQKIITINPNIQCWFTDEEKETFFVHELGHCVLGRLHDDRLLPNGDPRSLMAASRLDVYSICIYQVDDQECDKRYKRSYYLDELFDETTLVPHWGD